MKERPILFSAPMVRALLAGTKTQTRRPLKQVQIRSEAMPEPEWRSVHTLCPYGQPGGRLWVREAWRSGRLTDRFAPREMTPHPVWYEADGPAPDACNGKLRPGMFMPRWASRITLEVTGVRVEQLQNISEADARAEGSPCVDEVSGREVLFPDASKCGTFKLGYRCVWDSINGPGAWDLNPYVWCISFRVLER